MHLPLILHVTVTTICHRTTDETLRQARDWRHCLPRNETKFRTQNGTNPNSILKKDAEKKQYNFFFIQKPTAYTGWFKNRISPPALRGETRCRQHINHISGEFLKVLLLSRICHVLPPPGGGCVYLLPRFLVLLEIQAG